MHHRYSDQSVQSREPLLGSKKALDLVSYMACQNPSAKRPESMRPPIRVPPRFPRTTSKSATSSQPPAGVCPPPPPPTPAGPPPPTPAGPDPRPRAAGPVPRPRPHSGGSARPVEPSGIPVKSATGTELQVQVRPKSSEEGPKQLRPHQPEGKPPAKLLKKYHEQPVNNSPKESPDVPKLRPQPKRPMEQEKLNDDNVGKQGKVFAKSELPILVDAGTQTDFSNSGLPHYLLPSGQPPKPQKAGQRLWVCWNQSPVCWHTGFFAYFSMTPDEEEGFQCQIDKLICRKCGRSVEDKLVLCMYSGLFLSSYARA